jgi:hypothetical protein
VGRHGVPTLLVCRVCYNWAMPPEARLVTRIGKLIESQGGRPFKIVGDSEGLQEVGIPDILACYRGAFLGLEVKQPGAEKDVSPRQAHVLHQIREAGGIASVVSSVEEVERLLAKIDERR